MSLALLFMGEVRVIASDLRGLSTPAVHRGDVLEEAAKVAEEYVLISGCAMLGAPDTQTQRNLELSTKLMHALAKNIRALKEPQQ